MEIILVGWDGRLSSHEFTCSEDACCDKIKNEVIREKVGVTYVIDNMKETRLRRFEHVKRRCVGSPSEE
ncbi:hypothetical protein H5410_053632, partial [Solanum commersonii]